LKKINEINKVLKKQLNNFKKSFLN
jgi:hypothetical protein